VYKGGLVVDDGTGNVHVRVFGSEEHVVGGAVLVIGRPGNFGGSYYIMADVVKQILNKDWIKVRMKELGGARLTVKNRVTETAAPEKVVRKIKELDSGEGVDVDDIAALLSVSGVDVIVEGLLKKGELFEVKPGKVKILQ